MAKVKIKLNRSGVRDLLKSDEMKKNCESHAEAIRKRCGDGYEMDSYSGNTRVNAMVWAESGKARKDNLENKTLLKAVR